MTILELLNHISTIPDADIRNMSIEEAQTLSSLIAEFNIALENLENDKQVTARIQKIQNSQQNLSSSLSSLFCSITEEEKLLNQQAEELIRVREYKDTIQSKQTLVDQRLCMFNQEKPKAKTTALEIAPPQNNKTGTCIIL